MPPGRRNHRSPEPDLGQFLGTHLQIMKPMADALVCQLTVDMKIRPCLIEEKLLGDVEGHDQSRVKILLSFNRHLGGNKAFGDCLMRSHVSEEISATNTR